MPTRCWHGWKAHVLHSVAQASAKLVRGSLVLASTVLHRGTPDAGCNAQRYSCCVFLNLRVALELQ